MIVGLLAGLATVAAAGTTYEATAIGDFGITAGLTGASGVDVFFEDVYTLGGGIASNTDTLSSGTGTTSQKAETTGGTTGPGVAESVLLTDGSVLVVNLSAGSVTVTFELDYHLSASASADDDLREYAYGAAVVALFIGDSLFPDFFREVYAESDFDPSPSDVSGTYSSSVVLGAFQTLEFFIAVDVYGAGYTVPLPSAAWGGIGVMGILMLGRMARRRRTSVF
jgi:hypothetical protein